ncbi:hypothetical protein HYV31_02475 [candidate division WWE3 bacterium]|nr:hypothetical protein [candidate division WWE3 bacterium]
MKALKILTIIFAIALIGAGGFYIYFTRFSTRVLINPIEYTTFKRAVPQSPDLCSRTDAIEFYYYDSSDKGVRSNNKFGLYIYPDSEQFVKLADELVNSNGGDWGYVLIPYNLQDTDEEKWQRLFFLLHKKHLIPVVQLWNINPDEVESDTKKAAKFLNQFLWPVKQKYISAYNEPNDANFWYNRVDPKEYAKILNKTIEIFKAQDNDFFVMNGALNLTAPNASGYMDAFDYMKKMDEEVPGIFDKLDGFASHSYPQPDFSGSPTDTGRASIRGYEVELAFLKDTLQVTKELPVFITETGWAHAEGKKYNSNYMLGSKTAQNIKAAYEKVWLSDPKVQAVMPFTIWYESPADHFAWVDQNGSPYEQFQVVKAMKKVAGNPERLNLASVSALGCDKR